MLTSQQKYVIFVDKSTNKEEIMNILKKAYCRLFQTGFRVAMPFLPYREPKIYYSCKELEEVFKKEKSRSVLVVTDKGIVENGLLIPIIDVLKKSGVLYTVYDKTCPNPTVDNVEEALSLYKNNFCDTLLAVGGGSSIDCAKAVGSRVVYPKRSLDKIKGILKIHRPLPPLVAIPTTAGTGSEVTLAALITDTTTHQKYALMSFPLIPRYAVLDKTLTYSLPKSLTATTGVDALTHAVEAYIGQSSTSETRALAVEAAKLVFSNLENAYNCGNDPIARENMLKAAYKAGIAFSKSYVGYIHAIAHALGGKYSVPHGLANAVVMPYVLEYYGECVYKKLYSLGCEIGVCEKSDSEEVGAKKFINAVKKLNEKLNIPTKIKGIKDSDISYLASHAEKEANPLYPVPKLLEKKELEKIIRKVQDWSEE